MPCSTSNNFDVRFTVIIEPNQPVRVEVKDNTNYAALGITQSTVRGNVVIHDPEMNVVYRNDSFISPDIVRATTDTAIVTTKIPSSRIVYTGTWNICYKIQYGTTPNLEYDCEVKTFTIRFKEYCINQQFLQDCFVAKLTSTDYTNYTQIDATRTAESYAHTLISEKSTASSGSLTLSQQFPNLYNEEYTSAITARNLYTFTNNFRIRYTVTSTNKYIVDCHLDTCSAACCVECLRQRMVANEIVNSTMYENYLEQFTLATSLLVLYEAALRCGNLLDANNISKQIHEITDCNNGCKDCNCSESSQVKPVQQQCNGDCEPCPECPDCPPCPPCPTVYGNTLITESVTRNNCPVGTIPVAVTYSLAANTYTSMVSQLTAQNQAQFFFNATKQQYANDNGTCQANCAGVGQSAIPLGCCAGLVIQDGICRTTCNNGFSPDANGVCVQDIDFGCNEAVASGGAGTTTYEYQLNPAGGVFTMLVNAADIPDIFTLTVDGDVVSGSSMTLSNGDSAGVPATGIGTNLGTVPTRLTEYVTDTGTVPTGLSNYQQILWFKYTALDYASFVSKKITLTIVGTGNTIWFISRFCSDLENGGTCQTNGQTVTTECCDALVNDGGVCAVTCSEPTDVIINGVCFTCIPDGQFNNGDYRLCCSGNSANGICISSCVPNEQITGDGLANSCCSGVVLPDGTCTGDCVPNGQSIIGSLIPCCSGYAIDGICQEAPTIDCANYIGEPTEIISCPGDGTECTTVYTGTGNSYTGVSGTIDFLGCEFTFTSFNCRNLADGETCTPS